MAKKSKKIQLVELYGDCLKLDNRLECKMDKLGRLATEIYGEELIADMCAGSEIEFRRLDDNGFVDADSTIILEDIIVKNKITHNNEKTISNPDFIGALLSNANSIPN